MTILAAMLASVSCGTSEESGPRSQLAVTGGDLSTISSDSECSESELTVILLHGASYSAQTWLDLGLLKELCDSGYDTLAVDLPGFGESASFDHSRETLMEELVASVDGRAVLVVPSMSGSYVLPWINESPNPPAGLIAVAPVGLNSWIPSDDLSTELYLIWGAEDNVISTGVARNFAARTETPLSEISGGGHAVYDTNPQEFRVLVEAFLDELDTASKVDEPQAIPDRFDAGARVSQELFNAIAIDGRFVPAYIDPGSGILTVLAGPESNEALVELLASSDFVGASDVDIRAIDFEPSLLVDDLKNAAENLFSDAAVEGGHIDWVNARLVVVLEIGSTSDDIRRVEQQIDSLGIGAESTAPEIQISTNQPDRET